MVKNIMNLKNKTEKDIEIIFNFLEPKNFYKEIIFTAEQKAFNKFNKNNSDFFDYENLEYFEEKRKFANMFLIDEESLVETFKFFLDREPFQVEKYNLITCDEDLRIKDD